MAILWPTTLPQRPIPEGYQETPPDVSLRTQMDQGPAKVRRRFTAGVREFQMSFILNNTEVESLDTFFITTTQSGTLKFDMPHPRDGTTQEVRFKEGPKYSALGGDTIRADIAVEKLP